MSKSRDSDPPVQLTFLLGAPPAKVSQLPDTEEDWMTTVAHWRSDLLSLRIALESVGLSGKTSQECSVLMRDRLLEPSLGKWFSAGMGSPTEFWTHSILECPKDAEESLLSDILEETGEHLLRYCLSPKACQGILRRAEKRGRILPPPLEAALKMVAEREEE